MKTTKIYILLFSVFILSSSTNFAQRSNDFTNLVTENLVESLNHDIDGVVEASIYNSLFLTKYYPDADMDEVLEELNEIAVESENPALRYKAQLAVLYLTNYGNENLNLENYKKSQSELFKMISEKLQSALLAASQN